MSKVPDVRAVVWDFDGVLNRSVADGEFIWARDFEADIGQSLTDFQRHVFQSDFDAVLCGQSDLLDRVDHWATACGYSGSAEELVDYWFTRDANPDAEVSDWVERLDVTGVRQVIATNNDPRRTRYIEQNLGYGDRMEAVLSSGNLGFRKPDPLFFEAVSAKLALPANSLMLVDDTEQNVFAARAQGWQAFHFADSSRDGLAKLLFG